MENECRIKKDIQTAHRGLYASYQVSAREQVARHMKLPFKIIAGPGEKYHDHEVDAGMAYIGLDVREKGEKFWQRVNKLAPPHASAKH